LENVDVAFDEQARWFVVERGEITVACNLAERPQLVPLDPHRPKSIRLASEPQIAIRDGGVELPPESVAILCD
jgi:maltooligosyltrehalose trehalohydrolase